MPYKHKKGITFKVSKMINRKMW